MKVCVVGLGTIGAPVAKYIREQGVQVCGYDLVEKALDDIKSFTEWKEVPKSDVYIVAVASDRVEDACREISNKDKVSLVSIESTVKVGACRKISKRYNLQNLVHCPHRYWVENPVDHGIKQPRVIGAINERSLEKGLEFYRSLDIPLHVCPTIEIAETCKIAENAHRFVQVAFAEELRRICEAKNIDFDEVRTACNTKWNVEILEAREGITGHIPKDTGYLKLLVDDALLIEGAILTDEIYKKWIGLSKKQNS